MARQYGGDRPQPRVSARHARERARPPRGRRLRRGRAGRALRHARLRLRGGRHARPGAGLRGGVRGPHGRLRGDLRVEGAADHRGLPADGRGGPVGGRRLRRRAVPRAERRASTRSGSSCTATTRPRPSCGSPSTSDIGYLVLDSFARSSAPSACSEPRAQDVLIRVTPGIKPSTHSYVQTGQLDSKFGFGLEDGLAAEAVRRVQASQRLEPRRDPRPHRLPDLRARALHEDDPAAGRLHRLRLPAAERRRRPRHRLHGRGRAGLDRGLRGRQGAGRCSRPSTRCRGS